MGVVKLEHLRFNQNKGRSLSPLSLNGPRYLTPKTLRYIVGTSQNNEDIRCLLYL